MRLVCSPTLSAVDIEAIRAGLQSRDQIVAESILEDIRNLLSQPSLTDSATLLATLIAHDALDIRIAVPDAGGGIFHDKLGIFTDSSLNSVSFRGSLNETLSGWAETGNYESFEVYCSWKSASDDSRIARHRQYFQSVWNNREPGLSVMGFPAAARDLLISVARASLHEITPTQRASADGRRVARPHQEAVLEDWRRNAYKGIVCHATGSGKTFTAVMAIRDHVTNGEPAVVLVPSRLLHTQWKKELQEQIPNLTILRVGNDANRWREDGRLSRFLRAPGETGPRIVLSTMQSAATSEFQSSIQGTANLLLVADEVHQMGSPRNASSLTIEAAKVLGLSATPERYNDSEGTDRILTAFGPKLKPEFTLRDAIADGTLVPYRYIPHAVTLSSSESDNWNELTREINRLYAIEAGSTSSPMSDRLQRLMLQRARIAKKATAKLAACTQIITTEFEHGQHWLVYLEDTSDIELLRTQLVHNGIRPIVYLSAMDGDQEAALAWFRRHGGVLLSVRCLDEGVDIPEVSHAVILASSQNPRQYVQRRGRVLRTAPGKAFATIHDMIVTFPQYESETTRVPAYQLAEIARAHAFASDALNASSRATLREIMIECGISLETTSTAQEGQEDDEGE